MNDDQGALPSTWWTIPEACIWIATHDDLCIAEADDRMRQSLFIADQTLEGRGVWKARKPLMDAASRGLIEITGRYWGQGSQQPIPALAWANLDFIFEHGDMIAGAPGYDPSADWWDTLRVNSDAVCAQWPPPAVACQPAAPATVATEPLSAPCSESRGEGLHRRIREWRAAAYPTGTAKPQGQLASECAKALGLASLHVRTYRRAFGRK